MPRRTLKIIDFRSRFFRSPQGAPGELSQNQRFFKKSSTVLHFSSLRPPRGSKRGLPRCPRSSFGANGKHAFRLRHSSLFASGAAPGPLKMTPKINLEKIIIRSRIFDRPHSDPGDSEVSKVRDVCANWHVFFENVRFASTRAQSGSKWGPKKLRNSDQWKPWGPPGPLV